MNSVQKKITEKVNQLSTELVQMARFMGEHPELAFHEFRAQQKLLSFLKKHGFKIKKGVGGIKTAFVATRKMGNGPNVGLLAEYDALPGLGHACGHNLIGPASCGAAVAILQVWPAISGTITVVGCPAEEGGGGKILLAKKGIFKRLSVAMMAHPDSRTEVVKKMLALIEIDIEFFGRASHAAAAPEKGINALDVATMIYSKVFTFRKTLSRDSRVHGIFTAAGEKPNIIPDYAALKYYVRALDMKYAKRIVKKIESIASKTARSFGAKMKMKINPLSYEPFHPNRALAYIFRQQLKDLNIKNEQGSETKGIGSSDVGNVCQQVPTIHPMIKIYNGPSCHTPQFAKAALSEEGYQGMIAASKALALTAYEIFSKPKHLKKIKKEFLRQKES